jgi:hypothetical protein
MGTTFAAASVRGTSNRAARRQESLSPYRREGAAAFRRQNDAVMNACVKPFCGYAGVCRHMTEGAAGGSRRSDDP